MRSSWRLLAAMIFDVLLAVTLLCAIPLYINLFAAIELHAQLTQQPAGGANVDVTISNSQPSTALQAQESGAVATLSRTTLSLFAPDAPSHFLVVRPLRMIARNSAPPKSLSQIQFQAYDNSQLLPHVRLLAGAPLSMSDTGGEMPRVLVTQQMTAVDDVRVGDVLTVDDNFYDQQALSVQVAGVWVPRDPADPFWNGRGFLSNPQRDSEPYIFPVLLAPMALAPALGQLSTAIVTQHWTFFTQTRAITLSHLPDISTALTHFRTRLAVSLAHINFVVSTLVITGLDAILAAVMAQQHQVSLAFTSVGVLVLGASLILLAVVVQVFIERDRDTLITALFRGASALQIVGSYAAQMLVAGMLATGLGVVFALWLAPALILSLVSPSALPGTPAASAIIAREVRLDQLVVPALIALLLSLLISIGAVLRTLQTVTRSLAASSADGRQQPFWQRFHLDIFLAVLCAVGYLDLAYFGAASRTVATPSPLLIAVPLLLLVAGALLCTRFFSPMAALWAWLAARGRGLTGLMSSKQFVHNRWQAMLQSLVTILALGVLTLAVVYDVNARYTAALEAAHRTGADVRLVEQTPQTPAADALVRAQLARLPGSPVVASAYRGSLYTQTYWNVAGGDRVAIDTLVIDPRTWASVADLSWQPSYSATSLTALMAMMRAHEPTTAEAAAQAGTAGDPLWVIVSRSFLRTQGHRLGDTFGLVLPNSSRRFSYFVVGAVVNDFPTLDPAHIPGGFIVAGQQALFAAMKTQGEVNAVAIGPNEYWLRSSNVDKLAAAVERQQASLGVASLVNRQSIESTLLNVPSLVGMRVLLIFGAISVGVLTLLALELQGVLDARRRRRRLMALRALGLSRTQIAAMLMEERLVATLFGAGGGVFVGWLLASAMLPYLAVGVAATSVINYGALVALPVTNLRLLAPVIVLFTGALLLEHAVMCLRAAWVPIDLWALNASD